MLPGTRTSIYEVLLLAAVVTALTLAAAWIYPIWDDRVLMLVVRETGAIWNNLNNRPLAALFCTFLLNHGLFLPVGVVLHWFTWLGMGLVTMRLWRLMFPAYARFALLPALLSVAPILCKMQLVVLTVVITGLLGPVLSFLAIFMLWSQPPSRWRKISVGAGGLALIAFAILISEYGVVTAAVGFILLSAKAIQAEKERKRELQIVAALIAVCALFSYLVFLWLTRAAGFDDYRPGYVLESFSLRIPFRLLSGIWRGAIGAVLESLGSVTLHSKAALMSFVLGVVFSSLVVLLINRKGEIEFARKQNQFSVITLLVAMVVALIPVVLMDRTLDFKQDSRFWLPALPVLSSLSVYILFYVLKPRLYFLVPLLCGFLAGYSTTSEIAYGFRNPNPLTVWVQDSNREIADCIKRDVGARSTMGGVP